MLGEMAADVDAATLLVYRAAWMRDARNTRTTTEAAMAKMIATESAQRVIDKAVQLHGARGVTRGEQVERLYRDVRVLGIGGGTVEIMNEIIAKQRDIKARPAHGGGNRVGIGGRSATVDQPTTAS